MGLLFETEQMNDVTIVRPLSTDFSCVIPPPEMIAAIIECGGPHTLVVDLVHVPSMSSLFLAKLIKLNNHQTAVRGRLVLCNIQPGVYQEFARNKLGEVFMIVDDLEAALAD